MFSRATVREWSVAVAGGLLLAAVLVDWSYAADDTVTAAAKRVVPAVFSVGLIGVGVWLRRRDVPSTEIRTVALGGESASG